MELPYKKSKEQYVTAKTAGCGIFLLCPDFGLDYGFTQWGQTLYEVAFKFLCI